MKMQIFVSGFPFTGMGKDSGHPVKWSDNSQYVLII